MKPLRMTGTSTALLALALFIATNDLTAQTAKTPPNWGIYLSPSTPFLAPVRWSGGAVYNISNNFGFSIDAGYGSEALNKPRFSGLAPGGRYRFGELRGEARYYRRNLSGGSPYIGLEFFYTHTAATLANGSFEQDSRAGNLAFDRADFIRKQWGIHWLTGYDFPIYKRFFGNIILGVGYVSRVNSYQNIENPVLLDDFRGNGFLFADPRKEGWSDSIHGVFRVRLGYYFPVGRGQKNENHFTSSKTNDQ